MRGRIGRRSGQTRFSAHPVAPQKDSESQLMLSPSSVAISPVSRVRAPERERRKRRVRDALLRHVRRRPDRLGERKLAAPRKESSARASHVAIPESVTNGTHQPLETLDVLARGLVVQDVGDVVRKDAFAAWGTEGRDVRRSSLRRHRAIDRRTCTLVDLRIATR